MTSYADQHGKWVYDWPEILTRMENESFTHEEYEEWRTAADNWVTCACGNQCDELERNEMGQPYDGNLYKLGLQFSWRIHQKMPKHARRILTQIERRTQQLLKEKL